MKIDERVVGGFLIIILLALWINFDPTLASLFFAMVLGAFILVTTDTVKTFKIESKPNKLKSLMFGVVGYITFLLSSMLTLSFLQKTSLVSNYSILNVADAFAQTQSVMMSQVAPALADNVWLTVLAFAILIPITETWSFTVFFEFLSERFPGFKQVSKTSLRTWLLVSIISLMFMFYHLTAKGLTNNDALIMVFLFGLVSWGMVVIEGQSLGAIIMHMIANGIAVFSMYGISLLASPILVWIVVGAIIYYLFNSKKFNIRRVFA